MTTESPEYLNALVVDDDEGMRGLIADILLRHGHMAVAVASAEEALASLPHYTFQVAYLDMNLPGTDGFVLGEWLRRTNPHMEITLVTGESAANLEVLCEEHAIGYVRKPFEVSDITDVVTRYLEGALLRAQERDAAAPDFAPPVAEYSADLPDYFALPSVPQRLEDRLGQKIGAGLANLRSLGRYTERERVAVFSALLTAKVLGLRLSRNSRGLTPWEEYDELMEERGKRREFDP